STVIDGQRIPFDHDRLEDYLATFLPPDGVASLMDWMADAARLRERAVAAGLDDPEVRALQDQSFQAWIDSYELPPDAATWIGLTLGCELATELTNVSALGGLLSFGIFLDGGQECFEVKGGNSRLIEALASAIRSPITLDARVTEIRRVGATGGSLEVGYRQGLENRVLRARRVVVAIPPLHLHRIKYDPPLSGERWGAVNSLGRGQYTVVHFLIDGTSPVLAGETHFPYITYGPLGVIYGPGAPADDGDGNRVFSLLVYGAFAQAYHLTPKDLMTSGALAALDAQWPGFSDHVVDTHVYTYHPAAVAFHPVGRSPLDDYARVMRTPTDDGIWFVGPYQYGSHSHDAARSALETAEAIAADPGATRR
ncbi:FAD-dependent oxidoreductase, partial [bacterium]|nr:FAD-dependent oxidoreductase [bacterium]